MANKQASGQMPQPAAMIQQIPPDHGTYALIYRCDTPFRTIAGKLGPIGFSTGYWIYVGSAFGPGGLKARLGHHLNPSPRPHWHLDYVKHALKPVEIWITTDAVKHEHAWACELAHLRGATCPIAGFGASDCSCQAHLIRLHRRPAFNGFRTRIGCASHGPLVRISVT